MGFSKVPTDPAGLAERAQRSVRLSGELAGEVARLANAIASTEARLAAGWEAIADRHPERADVLRRRAALARGHALRERHAAQRWHAVHQRRPRMPMSEIDELDGLGSDVVHQATGMIVAQLGTTAQEAFRRLRGHAENAARPLYDVAADVVARVLRF